MLLVSAMPLLPLSEVSAQLVCPACRSCLPAPWRACGTCGREFPVAGGKPVLVDFDCSVLDREELLRRSGASAIKRQIRSEIVEHVLKISQTRNHVAPRQIAMILALARELRRRPRVLIVGGGTIGAGMNALYQDPNVDIVSFDIYATPHVQLIADAHRIPFKDRSFDAVVIQAVLEHVVRPAEVVSELCRVLCPDGLVYAETPFMQQVHEGPYDFTRFTESGHRYLFRDFVEVSSGVVAGPATQLVWSIDYFCRGLLRSNAAGRVARLGFSWLGWLDRFMPAEFAVDGASCFFFSGRLAGVPIETKELIRRYKGAQRRKKTDES
jgi:SAM-dependent methyltransferase